MRTSFATLLTGCALASSAAPTATAQEAAGRKIYQQQCARCHGNDGEGVAKHFDRPLVGNRSLPQLTRYIERTMPEDAAEKCTGEDAAKVAAYIFDAFYSPAAQARKQQPRVELARLTVNEYRNAVADVVGTYRVPASAGRGGGVNSPTGRMPMVGPIPADAKGPGLYAEYTRSTGKGKRALLMARTDPVVRFDFGPSSADFEKLKSDDFTATWQGAVLALETGVYDFIVRTEHAARLWINDTQQPIIDAWVKSGDDTEFRGSAYLLAGRAYPLRLDFARGNVGVRKERKDLPTVKTTIALEWKPPHQIAQVIPERYLAPIQADTSFALTTPFPPDDRSVGYERGSTLSKAYLQAVVDGAIETANYVTTNLAELSGVRADDAARNDRLQAFCVRLVERAFRRPLSPEHKRLYVDQHFAAASAPEAAVKRVVLLALQSPYFLYREPGVGGSKAADAFDRAARLSFGLWDSLPDDELLRAATQGRLNTRQDLTREAERMLTDRRARTKLHSFLMRWLKLDHGEELAKDPKAFPSFDAAVVNDLHTSLQMTLEDIVWSEKSDLRELLKAEHLYLNGRLARLYGGDVPPEAPFRKVALKGGDRAGVLTHPYLLAHLSYVTETSPIHRGVFLARNVLGVTLRQPPDAFTPLDPHLHPKLTTRERTTLQTNSKFCMGCHSVINPLGYTLEGFDAIGRVRDKEKGKPIDASGSYVTRSGDTVHFKNSRDLVAFLAESEEVHEAFTARLFHYYIRQPILAYGPDKLQELRRFFADNGYNVRRLVIEAVVQAALADRSPAK